MYSIIRHKDPIDLSRIHLNLNDHETIEGEAGEDKYSKCMDLKTPASRGGCTPPAFPLNPPLH